MRVKVSFLIDRSIDRELEYLAIDLGLKKYQVVELGVKVLSELLRHGKLSPGTEKLLEELRKKLEEVSKQ